MGFRLGEVDITHGVMLAPMAGFSDRAMRVVSRMQGAEYSVTEMISAKAVTFGDRKTFALAGIRADEGAVGLQIFGKEPEIMARAAEILSVGRAEEGYVPPVAIDINMGCPVHKIYGNGEGSALMRDPELIYRIVECVKRSIDIPVTVKLRRGVDEGSVNAVECAQAAQSGGAAMICLHGRTRVQMYAGEVDREIIKEVKKSLHIPLIANGDITCALDACDMLEQTGADGVAIGRGAVGNPFIFSEVVALLSGEKYTPPTMEERVEYALLQLRLSIEDKGERVAVTEARKQIAMYLKAFRGAARLRGLINTLTTYDEVAGVLTSLLSYEI